MKRFHVLSGCAAFLVAALSLFIAQNVFAESGWLGVSMRKVELVLVTNVAKNGPASIAGIRKGDVIVGYDGKTVTDPQMLRNMVAATPVNKTVAIKLFRNGKPMTVETAIAGLPAAAQNQVASSSDASSVAGYYYTYPDGPNTPIILSANGNWQWGGLSVGKYRVSNGSVEFDGVGGPATWGPAAIGPDSITFTVPGPPISYAVYRKAGPVPAQLLGAFSGGGETCLEFKADGSYLAEAPHGTGGYIVFGGKKVRFFGGPAGEWGSADLGNGTLTFHPGGRLVGFGRVAQGTVWVYNKTAACRQASKGPLVRSGPGFQAPTGRHTNNGLGW